MEGKIMYQEYIWKKYKTQEKQVNTFAENYKEFISKGKLSVYVSKRALNYVKRQDLRN